MIIYTFYSYKGGVGRTMALANIAELLYEAGLKVLMVDWDLEAPGLERFFPIVIEEVLNHRGLVDMLLEYKRQMSQEPLDVESEAKELSLEDLDSYIVDIYPKASTKGRLWLLPAGRRLKDYFAKYANAVLTFDWKDFYQNWEGNLYFDWMRQQFEEVIHADVVLIDSRTGVTEMGGVCTYQLADVIVMLCAANRQNLEGIHSMANEFRRSEVKVLRNGRTLEIIVVPARLEQAEGEKLNKFKKDFLRLARAFAPAIPVFERHPEILWELGIPYVPYYAFSEAIAVKEREEAIARPLTASFQKLVRTLARIAPSDSPLKSAFGSDYAYDASYLSLSSADYVYDVFVSYSTHDTDWVWKWLVPQLKNADLRVCIDREAFEVGAPIVVNIQNAIATSRRILFVLTPSWVESEFTRLEPFLSNQEFLTRVLPVLHEPCKLPSRLAMLTYADLTSKTDNEYSFARVLDALHDAQRLPSIGSQIDGSVVNITQSDANIIINQSSTPRADRPMSYIPFSRNALFVPRLGEFEQLEVLMFGAEQNLPRARLIGLVGMGGVGKTQLAVEMAYRCLDQQRFPAGIFWMQATGLSLSDWQHHLAKLAFDSDYLPLNDNVSNSENEVRRARYFCRYLAQHSDALLILDNVENPDLLISSLPVLAGGEMACAILYTSRNTMAPPAVMIHHVASLLEEDALRLLLEEPRPELFSKALSGSRDAEVSAARLVCKTVGYLPLALVLLREMLNRDQQVTLVRLVEVLKQRSILDTTRTVNTALQLSWETVRDEGARRLFKLASYFPDAIPIPLSLLGLATGLGENADIFEPLGKARVQLYERSLLESLSGNHVRLHPLVREFGRRLVLEQGDRGKALLEEAKERLVSEFANLSNLERRARRDGYWNCLDQVHTACEYAELLGGDNALQLKRVERWLNREGYLIGDERWWPQKLPGLFYQQLYNRSIEEGHPLIGKEAPERWLQQLGQTGAEAISLLRIFTGHTSGVMSATFSPDGSKVLTGSADRTARLWEATTGQLLQILEGHTGNIELMIFSPDGTLAITSDHHGRVLFWQTGGPDAGKLLGIYMATYAIGAIHWQERTKLTLADKGGPRSQPHFYPLEMKGQW